MDERRDQETIEEVEVLGLNLESEYEVAESHVATWFESLTGKGEHIELDRSQLRTFLENHGGNFNLPEAGLKDFDKDKYSRNQRAAIMRTVWDRRDEKSERTYYDRFLLMCDRTVAELEAKIHRDLPAVKFKKTGNKSKTEGIWGFFADLTAFAANPKFSYDELNFRTSVRLFNGISWRIGIPKDEYKIRITIPGYNKGEDGKEIPFAPAGVQMEFLAEAFKEISSW